MLVDIDGALLVGVEADSVCDDEQPVTRAAGAQGCTGDSDDRFHDVPPGFSTLTGPRMRQS
jgi:hypothetical protein